MRLYFPEQIPDSEIIVRTTVGNQNYGRKKCFKQGCDVPLSISQTFVSFEGSTSAPITSNIVLNKEDLENLDVAGQMFVSFQGDCSDQKLQDQLLSGGLEAIFSTLNGSIQIIPQNLQSVIKPTGALGFLADLFVDDITVDIFNISFSIQSDPFVVSENGTFSTDVEIEMLSGTSVADVPLIPGGVQTSDLTGEIVSTSLVGQISQDENKLLRVEVPGFTVSLDVGVSGVAANVELAGDLVAQEVA
eukprot:TRINITY_DN3874_c0_g1_i4.p1 TRINITY_DN3874_c0_g1~~TRINITY_DN3874_c0_g1_i4.p1  ORF type:complete len:246 (-),score=53.63 TRINITY_DN3874_c0_g1_i4:586-1323(-)